MAQQQRGQAIQIGAVLLFAILIILLSTYQAVVVPSQNEEIEFNHNQEVQNDMADLRNAIISSTDSTTTRSVSLTLGTTYPSRSLFVNPTAPSGALRTSGTASPMVNVTIDNATTTGDASDFWDGSAHPYSTGRVAYRPNYNVYAQPPDTVYENGIVYNRFRDANVTVTDQQLIDGDTINLVALNGSVGDSRSGTVSVDVRSISASDNSVAVTNVSAGSPVSITIPTKLTASEWNTLLEDERTGGNVVDVSAAGQTTVDGEVWRLVEIDLQEDTTYTLQMSRVGIGSNVERSLGDAYLQRIAGNGTTVPEGSETTLIVEARDEYNNPADGQLVQASTNRGDSSVTSIAETGGEGRVELTYEAPSNIDGGVKTDRVNVSLDVSPSAVGATFDTAAPRNVTFDLTVDNTDGSGTGGGGGDPPAYSIYLENTTGSQMDTQDGVDCGARPAGECEYDFASDADDKFDLYATTDPTAIGANVDWSLNSTGPGDFSSEDSETDGSGDATATFDAQTVGAIKAYVSSGQTSDDIVVELVDTSGGPNVFSSVEPAPEKLSDSNGEFVRIFFPSKTDINGWEIEENGGSGQIATTTTEVKGEIFLAKNPTTFAETWSLPPGDVYDYPAPGLNNDDSNGDAIALKDSSGTVIDEFGYDGGTTSGGWTLNNVNSGSEKGRVAYRTKTSGIYDDTDSDSDWQIEADENVFFNNRAGSDPAPGMVFSRDVPDSTFYMKSLDTSQRVGFFDVTDPETYTRMTNDFNGDGTTDAIYVDGNQNIRLTDHNGNDELLLDNNNIAAATTRLTIGDFNGDGDAQVYFADGNGELAELQYNGGSPTVSYITRSNGNNIKASSAVGVGNLDTTSGTPELVFTSNNGNLAYVTADGNDPVTIASSGPDRPSDTSAVSEPRDFDDDTEIEVAYVEGGDIRLADSSGTDGSFATPDTVSTGPIAPLELDSGNNVPEIVYVDGGTLKYYATDGSSGTVTDEHGTTLEADASKGAV